MKAPDLWCRSGAWNSNATDRPLQPVAWWCELGLSAARHRPSCAARGGRGDVTEKFHGRTPQIQVDDRNIAKLSGGVNCIAVHVFSRTTSTCNVRLSNPIALEGLGSMSYRSVFHSFFGYNRVTLWVWIERTYCKHNKRYPDTDCPNRWVQGGLKGHRDPGAGSVECPKKDSHHPYRSFCTVIWMGLPTFEIYFGNFNCRWSLECWASALRIKCLWWLDITISYRRFNQNRFH